MIERPLAGRLSEIGQAILEEGAKKAQLICTGNWEDLAGQKDDTQSQMTNCKKVTDYNAFTYKSKPKCPKHVGLKLNEEDERVKRAMKSGQITPISTTRYASTKRPSEIFTKPVERGQFEI